MFISFEFHQQQSSKQVYIWEKIIVFSETKCYIYVLSLPSLPLILEQKNNTSSSLLITVSTKTARTRHKDWHTGSEWRGPNRLAARRIIMAGPLLAPHHAAPHQLSGHSLLEFRTSGVGVRDVEIQAATERLTKHLNVSGLTARHNITNNKKKFGESLLADFGNVQPFRGKLNRIINETGLMLSQLYNSNETDNIRNYTIKSTIFKWSSSWQNTKNTTLSNTWKNILLDNDGEIDLEGLEGQDFEEQLLMG
uniref:Uncharacterized protein n=1 Tax=Timema poppense TaxID=170557 RepID=A0A7R9H1Z0_TIMPO|nr:unnamed protein product [Timema poppensis]